MIMDAENIPPADDFRNLVDHLNGLMNSLDDSVSNEQVYEQLRVAWNMARDLRPRGPITDARVREAVIAERARATAHAREGYRHNFRCDDIAARILSGEAAVETELHPALRALAGGVLPDPQGGCACEPFEQSAGGIYTELLLDYDPACPVHSRHLYDPRSGRWITRKAQR